MFRLTQRGKDLKPILLELGRWGGSLLATGAKNDHFCTHWLALPLQLHLRDAEPDGMPVAMELRTGDQPMTIEAANGSIHVRPGPAEHPGAVLRGSPQLILGVLIGNLELKRAKAAGLRIEGDPQILRRLAHRPATPD
ncbi:MAG: SCP2 sterol-binding domain-containing protein [Acidobacteriota bacterium]|nr:SCP2 sterol-binding domain-containing protein [Acidobacteriota bacterium]